MYSKNIKTISLPDYANVALEKVFNEIGLNTSFLNYSWIAGGFSRYLFRQLMFSQSSNFSNNLKTKKICEKLFKYIEYADIDVFSHSEKEVENIQDLFCKNQVSYHDDFYHSNSLFSKNLNKFIVPEDDNRPFSGFSVKVQLVNKFFFENISECLESFDITNCKFALSKNNKGFVITYFKEAEDFEKNNILHISNFDNIFLAERIGKYMSKHRLEVIRDERFSKKLKEYLYMILEDNCSFDITKSDMSILRERAVKSLHRNIKLSNSELILFLGMYKDVVYNKNNASYGFYYDTGKKVDWARQQINC